MQRVIDLARVLRERHSKPLKQPLRTLTVIHPDSAFLADLSGALRPYVVGEVNVVELETCDDPSKFCTVRAQPEWQVRGAVPGIKCGILFPGVGPGVILPDFSSAVERLTGFEVS